MDEVIIGFSTGLVSGLLSGYLVYLLTKRREQKYFLYNFWRSYLYDTLKHCEMYVPIEKLNHISAIDNRDSVWGNAIFAILNDTRPFELDDRELTEHESRIADNVFIALQELDKWKKKNKLH